MSVRRTIDFGRRCRVSATVLRWMMGWYIHRSRHTRQQHTVSNVLVEVERCTGSRANIAWRKRDCRAVSRPLYFYCRTHGTVACCRDPLIGRPYISICKGVAQRCCEGKKRRERLQRAHRRWTPSKSRHGARLLIVHAAAVATVLWRCLQALRTRK